jgi:hypothetical protein
MGPETSDLSKEGVVFVLWVGRFSDIRASAVTSAVPQWIVTANAAPSSLILSTLRIEAMRSSETSVTRRYIPENDIIQIYFLLKILK